MLLLSVLMRVANDSRDTQEGIEDAIVSCFTFPGFVKINILFIHPEVLLFPEASENREKILRKIFIQDTYIWKCIS